jgi:predicted metal-binding membrane protein
MVKAALETVLRRDRIVVAAALAVLAALAWGYVLWLGADMNMGGMDMTGFRMIPAGLGEGQGECRHLHRRSRRRAPSGGASPYF